MQNPKPSLFGRHDTIFGVCEALGEDFGFNPLYLRMTLAALILVSPVAVFASYAAAGVIVALSRWLYPDTRRAVASPHNDANAPVPMRSETAAEDAEVRAEPALAYAA